MRIIPLDSVKGNEILAKDIVNNNNTTLIPSGTIMKKEYVTRLKELNIEFIYVEDELGEGIELVDSLEMQIKDQCLENMKDILLKYSYNNETELQEIKAVADDIIESILSNPEFIFNLSSIRSKSESIYSHSLNVCALSVLVAIKLKLKQEIIRNIAIGCLLHDIGFTYITIDYQDLILDNCTQKEIIEIKKHVIYGYSAVENMDWLSPIAKDIILNHHERNDGSGYPFRLTDKRIKIWSKIVAVCDEFDSRVYGNLTKKMKVHEAIDYIVSQAEVKFNLDVVDAFVASVAAYPTGALVMTNEGEIGIVLRQNPKCPTRPVIRIIQDINGDKPEIWTEKDLTKELTLFITDTILD